VSGRVRVLLFHEASDRDAVTAAYHLVSAELAGTPGLLGNELLTSVHDPTWLLVMSEWADRKSFDEWEQTAAHKGQTAALRPFRDTRMPRAFGIFEVQAEY
jgi:heme oxygenase (mycobilin-producing)